MNTSKEPSEPASAFKRSILAFAVATGALGALQQDSTRTSVTKQTHTVEVMNNLPVLVRGIKEYNVGKVIAVLIEPATLVIRQADERQERSRHRVIEGYIEEDQYNRELETLLLEVINTHFCETTSLSLMGDEMIRMSTREKLHSVNNAIIQSYSTESNFGKLTRIHDHSLKSMELLEQLLYSKHGIAIENISVDQTTEDDFMKGSLQRQNITYNDAFYVNPEVEHHITLTASFKGNTREVGVALPLGVILCLMNYYSSSEKNRRSRKRSLAKRMKSL